MNRTQWSAILFWAGVSLFAAGFVYCEQWRWIALRPTAGFICLALISWVLGAGVRRIFRCERATALLVVWCSALVFFLGIASILGVLLMVAGAVAIGSLLTSAFLKDSVEVSVLTGLALLGGTAGWLLPFPLHVRAVYVPILILLAAVRWRVITAAVRPLATSWRAAVTAAPRASLITITGVGLVSTCAWLPTLSYDALAYHLALPTQLFQLGYYQMNVGSNVWALAPWAADVLQGMTWVVAGSESNGAVAILWLGLTLALLWRLTRELGLEPWLCWMAVALYVSLPLVAGTLLSMQTEAPTAAVLVGMALFIQRVRSPECRDLLVAAVLFGLLMALKVSNALFAGPLGLWLCWQWRGHMPWRGLPIAVVLACFVGGSSYTYAWVLTGNPVLPLFNGFFHSPFYPPVSFSDPRWTSGFSWNLPWRLVFDSSRYDEAGNGIGPIVLIALGGSLMAALFRPRSAALAAVALVGFVLPLTQVQYLRYAMPVMVLMIPAMLCGLRCDSMSPRQLKLAATVLCTLAVTGLLFVSSGTWQLKSGALLKLLGHGRAFVVRHYAVERDFAVAARQRYGRRARTLLIDPKRPFAADFAGQGLVVAWYDPSLSALAGEARVTDARSAWSCLFQRSGANLLLVSNGSMSRGMSSAIDAFHGKGVLVIDGFELWELGLAPDGDVSTKSVVRSAGAVDPRSDSSCGLHAGEAPVDLVAQRNLALKIRGKLAFWRNRDSKGSHL